MTSRTRKNIIRAGGAVAIAIMIAFIACFTYVIFVAVRTILAD
jgi:ABC-type Na+ efflux pump permease subunit